MVHYINKDTLVAEIDKNIKQYEKAFDSPSFAKGKYRKLLDILHINTLEVKDANLDNEYINEVYSHLDSIKDTADRMTGGNFMHNKAAIRFSANTITKVLELMGIK